MSKKRKIASSPSSDSIRSKTSERKNSRKKWYTQRIINKCVAEEDDSIKSKEDDEEKKEKINKPSQTTKVNLLTMF